MRIVAPHFVAGIEFKKGRAFKTAPILAYMKGWSFGKVTGYARAKGWSYDSASHNKTSIGGGERIDGHNPPVDPAGAVEGGGLQHEGKA